jgi:hypothetical protein
MISHDEEFGAAVQARVALLEQARRVLPEGRFDALSERELQELVLREVYGAAVSFADKSAAYVRGLFGHAVEAGRLDAAAGDDETSSRAAFAPLTPRFKPAWRQPLTVAKAAREVPEGTPGWQRPLSYSIKRTTERAALGQIKRGGVARDARGKLLPPWAQPLSYNLSSKYRPALELPREDG